MNQATTRDGSLRDAPPFLERPEAGASAIVGAVAVTALAAIEGFTRWITESNGWVLFFLVTKPLIDLTWRWQFFRFSQQAVNIQTYVGLAVLALNAIAIVSRSAWRGMPRRVVIFLACATLSVAISPSSGGLNELLRLLAGLTFFYTAGPYLSESSRFDRFAKIFLCAVAVPVVLTFFQAGGVLPYEYFDWNENGELGRASGTYPTPLSLNYFLIYAFPLALYVADGKGQSTLSKWGARLFLLLASLALALTYHRVSYVVIAVQLLLWLFMSRGLKAASLLALVLAVVAFSFSGGLSMLYAPLGQSLSGQVDIRSGEFLRGRGFQWFLFLDSYASGGPTTWALGRGGSVIPGVETVEGVLDADEPHNDFIRILHAYGLVGLLLYLSILVLFVRRTFFVLRSNDPFARNLGRITLLALTAFLALSMTTEPTRYPTGVWYLFALGSALFWVGRNVGRPQIGSLRA
jgi:O-antigen ligase